MTAQCAYFELDGGGSVDDDFARMVRAPMLLLGSFGTELKVGSSYSVYAAAASAGHVRSPACFLRYDACMPPGAAPDAPSAHSMAPTWLGYVHPTCKHCRDLKADAKLWPRIAAVRDVLKAHEQSGEG